MIEEITFAPAPGEAHVSALFREPENAKALLVMAHGAGAGMRHPFMEAVSELLAERGIATFRYQFPYMEQGKKRPDPRKRLLACVRAAVAEAQLLRPKTPLFAGGKSMGGRMTSGAAAESPLAEVRGLVFFGFPLHPAGKPGTQRADHLDQVGPPMLFLQGTRDALADLTLLRPICVRLEQTLYIAEGADHSFKVLKRSGRTDEEVLVTLADESERWISAQLT